MKQSRFYILFFFVVCIGLFCSCLSNDDDAQWSKFNGVYVTVGGDNIRGYKLYTDFGAILVPTEESLNRIPSCVLRQIRVFHTFRLWNWEKIHFIIPNTIDNISFISDSTKIGRAHV